MTYSLTRRVAIAAAGALPLTAALARHPGPGSEGPRGFHFLSGRWNVRHRKLRERLARSDDWIEFGGTLEVEPILAGFGNFDRNELADPSGAYEAHSLRLYNPTTRLWSIWWLDERSPSLEAPVVGRFERGKGHFYSDERFRGRSVKVRTTYEPLGPRDAEWTQAFSADRGASWETNWVMNFTRAQ
jgi:hypothetical protein